MFNWRLAWLLEQLGNWLFDLGDDLTMAADHIRCPGDRLTSEGVLRAASPAQRQWALARLRAALRAGLLRAKAPLEMLDGAGLAAEADIILLDLYPQELAGLMRPRWLIQPPPAPEPLARFKRVVLR